MGCAERFSTQSIAPDKRLSSWSDAARDRFVELDFHISTPEEFVGSMLHRDMTALSLTHIVSAAHGVKQVSRSQRLANRAAEEFFLASIQLEGGCRVCQDGREADLKPGEFALYDTTRPYELVLDKDYQQVVLRIPRRILSRRLKGCETLTATAIAADSLPARMLVQMASAVCDEGKIWHPGVALDVADGMLSVLTGGLRTLLDPVHPPQTGEHQLARIKAYVVEHLGDPELSIGRIAAALALSQSYLHKVFRQEGTTLERWIWARRLDACERALRDPGNADRTITDIAFAWGYSDAAHFSRSFRQRFGVTPQALRKSAVRLPGN